MSVRNVASDRGVFKDALIVLTTLALYKFIYLNFAKGQASVGENLVREKWPETVYCLLHICIYTLWYLVVLVQAWYEWHLTWEGVPWNIREFHVVWRVVAVVSTDVESEGMSGNWLLRECEGIVLMVRGKWRVFWKLCDCCVWMQKFDCCLFM